MAKKESAGSDSQAIEEQIITRHGLNYPDRVKINWAYFTFLVQQ